MKKMMMVTKIIVFLIIEASIIIILPNIWVSIIMSLCILYHSLQLAFIISIWDDIIWDENVNKIKI